MPRPHLVSLYHPVLDVTTEVHEAAVRVFLKSGWTRLDDEKDEDQLELAFDTDEPGQPDANEE